MLQRETTTTADELAKYLLTGLVESDKIENFKAWLERRPHVLPFVEHHRTKLRKKIKGDKGRPENIEDIFAEVGVAARCLPGGRCELEYGKYEGSGKPGPDFTVTFDKAEVFNLEVARIRETPIQGRVQASVDALEKALSAKLAEVKAPFLVHLWDLDNTFSLQSEDDPAQSADYLMGFIKDMVAANAGLAPGENTDDVYLGYGDGVCLQLKRLDRDPEKPMVLAPLLVREMYDGREPFKFSDILFQKLKQLIPGMANIIVIRATSSTHEKEDLERGIDEIAELIKDRNEKFFENKAGLTIDEFQNKMSALSGIVAWTSTGPNLWRNPTAECPLSAAAAAYLEAIGIW